MKQKILAVLKTEDRPMDEKEIFDASEVERTDVGYFFSELDSLEKEGLIFKTRKKKYLLSEKVGLVAGKVSRNKKKFGFVIPSTDEKGDIFIPANGLNGAMNGDTVLVSITAGCVAKDRAGSREGEIIRILSRKAYKFAGIYEGNRNFGFVTDTGTGEDFFISKDNSGKAVDGDRVVIKVTKWPEKGKKAEGRVTEILGSSDNTNALLRSLVFQHGLRQEFPDKVLDEADRISEETDSEELKKRKDLRSRTIVTIDGAYAKDLDDAVSVEVMENGNYLLGVHIADVSHYVRKGSKIDREAYQRGTSVYYIDKVIPMLPEKLSNGVCSLNPHIPRLTLSCDMEISPTGEVISHDIYESVIRTSERLVYTDISDILENDDEELKARYSHILPEIYLMKNLAEILRKKRMIAGSIDFDLDETYIEVDKKGTVLNVSIAERREANRIIEEFMLVANQTVSEHFFWLDIPFLYRIHEKPDAEKVQILKDFLWNIGVPLKGSIENIHPRILNDIIEGIKGDPREQVVNTVILRTMSKARYSENADGHFGLGFRYYSHFTSPIRRYPDLLIHRIIKTFINGDWGESEEQYYRNFVAEAAVKSSDREAEAERMERDAEKLKIAEYMQTHVDEEYEGIISGVASAGFFVETGKGIEGFVRIDSLKDDYYELDRKSYRFIGKRTGKKYALGDAVTVIVSGADPVKREVNFELVYRKINS